MNTSFKIGDIQIGQREIPLVIPEIGINHEGSLKVAKLMVDAAYRAGARIVKHQTHIVEDEMSAAAKKVIPGNSTDSIYDIMARCALSEQEEYELMQYVQEKGMVFLSTPFSRAAEAMWPGQRQIGWSGLECWLTRSVQAR
jgi:sialic acid synthase SpsE